MQSLLKVKGWKRYTILRLILKKTSAIYIRQSRSQDKECYQGGKRFHNDNEVSSSRRCNNSKHSYPYTKASEYTEQKQNCEETFSNPQM